MSTRLAQERLAPGNRLVSHRLSLPCSAGELGEAVNRVRRQSQTVRASRMRDAARLALAPLTPRLGKWATSRMAVGDGGPLGYTGANVGKSADSFTSAQTVLPCRA